MAGTIVVTGASSGIGRACALRFTQLGFRVIAGVRTSTDADALRSAASGNLETVLLDVTQSDSIHEAFESLAGESVSGLINNAGIATIGPLELVGIEEWRRQFEVNVIGTVAVTQTLLPMLRAGRGRIVIVGSIAGKSALPCSGAYDASKFALEAITDSLRMEMRAFGVSVSIIEPGSVKTPIWEKSLIEIAALESRAGVYRKLISRMKDAIVESQRDAIGVDKVVKAVEHAMTNRNPKTRYPTGGEARLWLLLSLLPDRLRDKLILSKLGS